MTSPRNLLVRLAGALNASAMPWMITGSTASAFYGEPRATQDIDIVIDPQPEQLGSLLLALKEGFYVSAEEASDALRTRGMFNAIDLESGWKADIIVCPDGAFTSAGRRNRPVSRNSWQESSRWMPRGAGHEEALDLPGGPADCRT